MIDYLTLIAAAALTATDGQPVPQADIDALCKSKGNSPSVYAYLRPHDLNKLPAVRDKAGANTEANTGKILGYTRFRIDFYDCPAEDVRDYGDEKRNFLKRWFLGKHATKTVEFTMSYSPNGVETKRLAVSVNRKSGNDGENWETTINAPMIPSPYFRIDQGSKATVSARVNVSRDYDSNIAEGALELVTKATAAIIPSATLITDENKERFGKASSFVDTAISGLLKVTIEEHPTVEYPLLPGRDGQVLAIYALHLPFANNAYGNAAYPLKPAGIFVVAADRLRWSMFSDVSEGPLKATSLSPESILGYLVDDQKTIRERLGGAQIIASAQDELVSSGDADEQANKGYAICRLIATEAESIGLTPPDRAAVAWAYVKSMAFDPDKEGAVLAGCSRIDMFPLPPAR